MSDPTDRPAPPGGPDQPTLRPWSGGVIFSKVAFPDPITRPAPPTPDEINRSVTFHIHVPDASATAVRLQAGLDDAARRRAAVDAKAAPISSSSLPLGAVAPMVAPVNQVVRAPQTVAPPARIALTAGDRNAKPDWNMGRTQGAGAPIAVVPVMARAGDSAMPTMEGGLRIRPAREMDAGTANATLNSITANLRHWAADFPHTATGPGAVLLRTVRELIAADEARRNAAAYGQTTFKDPLDDANHTPPPESALLGQLQAQVRSVLEIYERVMRLAGLSLVNPDQAVIDTAKAMIGMPRN